MPMLIYVTMLGGLKDVSRPAERYSPVRRASVGSAHYTPDTSLRELQLEHQQLTQQQHVVSVYCTRILECYVVRYPKLYIVLVT